MNDLGKLLIVFGIVMVLVGGFLVVGGNLAGKVPWLGRLPGDIRIERENWSLYFPIATSLVLSIILTVIFSLVGRR